MTPPRLVVTSVVRHARQDRSTGRVRVLDTATGRVLARWEGPESRFRGQDQIRAEGCAGCAGRRCSASGWRSPTPNP